VRETKKFIDKQGQSVADMINAHPKPCIGFSFYTRENPFVRKLQDNGIVVLPSPTRAARALAALVRYVKLREKILTSA
jgi:acetate---CoA ligase (ADP-forming) subunit alpha